MSRYLGPIYKKSKKLDYSLLGTNQEFTDRKADQKGVARKRPKISSEYGIQLKEKQKVRFTYGIGEKQFRRFFLKALANKGKVTGTALLLLCESRLDNIVYRAGLARTRKASRQLVAHNHILVNGKKVNIPSYLLSVGDIIAVAEASKNLAVIKESLQVRSVKCPYVEVDVNRLEAKYLREPERSEIADSIKESLIVEYYNRSL